MAECAKRLINFTKNYKVFWRARALKKQIFKKLKGIFCTSRYKNKEHHVHKGMFNLKNLKVLTEVFYFRYKISFIASAHGIRQNISFSDIFHRNPLASGL